MQFNIFLKETTYLKEKSRYQTILDSELMK